MPHIGPQANNQQERSVRCRVYRMVRAPCVNGARNPGPLAALWKERRGAAAPHQELREGMASVHEGPPPQE